MQLRGQALMFWIEVLPPPAEDLVREAHEQVAAALRAERAG